MVIIHYIIRRDWSNRNVYLCNQACGTTPEKSTVLINEVTCRNCLRGLGKIKK